MSVAVHGPQCAQLQAKLGSPARERDQALARRTTCCAPDLGVGPRKVTPFRGGGMDHPPVRDYR